MNFTNLDYMVEDRIAIIKINNPPANTLGSKTLDDLDSALDYASDDDRVKAILLTGEGKMFVAGADIKEINAINSKETGEMTAIKGQQIFNKIEQMKKPVIAAVNGACLGGGMELAMSCHIRIAAETAKFGQPEINLGLIPGFGGTQRLARLTNRGIAIEWILTGDIHSADEALRLGIISKIVPTENIFKEGKALAKRISEKSSLAIEKSIQAIHIGLKMNQDEGLKKEAQLFGEICISEDKKEGVQAFLEKRAPIFKDK